MASVMSRLCCVCALVLLSTSARAEYSVKLVLKNPYSLECEDSLGQNWTDSLCRFMQFRLAIHRSEQESLYAVQETGDSGSAQVSFWAWSDSTPVSAESIVRMSLGLPLSQTVVNVGDSISFEPAEFDSLSFVDSPDRIEFLLPFTLTRHDFDIGNPQNPGGENVFDFAVLSDMHFGDGYGDYGTSGWDDATTHQRNGAIENAVNAIEAIRQLGVELIVLLGDVSNSGEVSQLTEAALVVQARGGIPCVPIAGNHDVWPYASSPPVEADVPDDCKIAETFGDVFHCLYDTAHLTLANYVLAVTEDDRSKYLNQCFDLLNLRFLCLDFNTRDHALWPWLGVLPEADIPSGTLDWESDCVSAASQTKREIVVLAHHPLLVNNTACFTSDEVWAISDAGLRNNHPIAHWLGGHTHEGGPQETERVMVGTDTMADAIRLVHSCKAGHYAVVHVYDNVKAEIAEPASGPLPVEVSCVPGFHNYSSDPGNDPAQAHWVFGDGQATLTDYDNHPHHVYTLPYNHDTTYSLTLEVITASGRYVSVCKRIQVVGSPYNLRTEFARPGGVKLVWNCDCPSLLKNYRIWRDKEEIGQASPGQMYWVDYNARPDQTYLYQVLAEHDGGDVQFSPPVGITVQMPGGWETMPDIPTGAAGKNVGAGGALVGAVTSSDEIVYALKGNSTREFYRYSATDNAWLTGEPIPELNRMSRKVRVKKGGTLVTGTNGKLYGSSGASTRDFWRYDPSADSWTQKADVPTGAKAVKEGAGAVAVVDGGTNYVYFLKGSGTFEFYRYNADADAWDTSLPSAPEGPWHTPYKNGSCLAYDGADTIYVLKAVRNELYAYSITGREWVSKETLPKVWPTGGKKKKVAGGAGLTYLDGRLHALKGGNTSELWSFSSGVWSAEEAVPVRSGSQKRVKDGGSLAAVGNLLWVLKGNNTREFYSYGPSGEGSPHGQYQPTTPGANEVAIATCANATATSPQWSPNDGEWVVYCRNDQNQSKLLRAPANGGQTTELASSSSSVEYSNPVPSPTGAQVAFVYTPGDSCSQIGVVPSGGGQVSILTSSSTDHGAGGVCWNSSGTGLYFTFDDASSGYVQLGYVSASGGSEQTITTSSMAHSHPCLLSSTELILEGEDASDGSSQIFRLNLQNGQEVQLTSGEDHENPSCAAGARLVACEMTGDGYTGIAVFSVDGGTETVISSGDFDWSSPAICHDGSVLSAVRQGSSGSAVCVFDLVEGTSHVLTDALADRDLC